MSNQFREAFQRMAKNAPNMSGAGGGPGRGFGDAAGKAVGSAMLALGLSYGAFHSIYTVQGGHRAVVFNRFSGMKDRVYGEGLNFNIPWLERPEIGRAHV